MEIKNEYLDGLYERVRQRDPDQPEFLQAVGEVLQSLAPVADRRPDLIEWGVFERMVEPVVRGFFMGRHLLLWFCFP